MAITAGEDILASDFISASAGAGDEGKVPKLDASGEVDRTFIIGNLKGAIKSFTAGEDIDAGEAVVIGNDSGTVELIEQDNQDGSKVMNDTNDFLAQSFTTSATTDKLVSFSFYLGKAGTSSTINTTLQIYLADGADKPTGSVLATKTKVISVSYSSQWTEYILDTALDVSSSTKYVAVLSGSSYDAESLNVQHESGTDDYAGGEANISTDGGSTYSDAAYDFRFRANMLQDWTDAGEVYLADASVDNTMANNFIGFADETITAGNTIKIKVGGYDNNQTGLSPGETYYLSDTSGAIATSAGTVTRAVGIALSATEILIKHENN